MCGMQAKRCTALAVLANDNNNMLCVHVPVCVRVLVSNSCARDLLVLGVFINFSSLFFLCCLSILEERSREEREAGRGA